MLIKTHKTIFYMSLVMFLIFFESCRKEDFELIEPPKDKVITSNSVTSSLILKTLSNDGSSDNILDKSNCFNIKLPVTIEANGNALNITSKRDYSIVEYLFDDDDDDIDVVNINYPITLIQEDFTEVTINNSNEFNTYSNKCHGENELDDDIECLDFQYPIQASTFNKNNELIESITFVSDYEFYTFIKNLSNDDVTTLNFPITIKLSNDSLVTINTITELETIINSHKNDCDEDDDYDYNDDDCNDCNVDELTSILTNCDGWTVDKLNRNYTNHDDVYQGYTFNFYPDGSIEIYWYTSSAFGTWTSSGTKNNITVTINIPDLPLCNNDWILSEISEYNNTRLDLRVNDSDRLRYNNACN